MRLLLSLLLGIIFSPPDAAVLSPDTIMEAVALMKNSGFSFDAKNGR
jgi:hypothetical protein